MHMTAKELVAEARRMIEEIDVEGLAGQLGEAPIIIDVREPAEYEQSHIFGAINIPRGVVEFEVEANPHVAERLAPELSVKDAEIVVYCRSGGRAALAATQLQKMGFSQLRSLAGGFLAWESAGKPVRQT